MEEDVMKNLTGGVEAEGEEEEIVEAEPVVEDAPAKEAEDPEETEEVEGEAVVEAEAKPRPFHKNPKFIRLQQERDEAIRQREEEARRYDEIIARLDRVQPALQAQATPAVPEDLRHIFGEDVESFRALTGHLVESYRAVSREEALAIRKQEDERNQATQKAQEKIIQQAEDSLAELSEETGEDFTNPDSDARNLLLNVCEEYGINDFSKAYTLYKKLNPGDTSISERKAIASNTSSKVAASATADAALTSAKLKKMRFNEFFE